MNEPSVAFLELILADWSPEEDEHIYCSEEDLLYEDYFPEKHLDPIRVFMSVSLIEFGGVDNVLAMLAFH